MKKYISILFKQYGSPLSLWSLLLLSDIKSECGYDNGFLTCEIFNEDLEKTLDLIRAWRKDDLTKLNVQPNMADGYEFRRNYWKTKI